MILHNKTFNKIYIARIAAKIQSRQNTARQNTARLDLRPIGHKYHLFRSNITKFCAVAEALPSWASTQSVCHLLRKTLYWVLLKRGRFSKTWNQGICYQCIELEHWTTGDNSERNWNCLGWYSLDCISSPNQKTCCNRWNIQTGCDSFIEISRSESYQLIFIMAVFVEESLNPILVGYVSPYFQVFYISYLCVCVLTKLRHIRMPVNCCVLSSPGRRKLALSKNKPGYEDVKSRWKPRRVKKFSPLSFRVLAKR